MSLPPIVQFDPRTPFMDPQLEHQLRAFGADEVEPWAVAGSIDPWEALPPNGSIVSGDDGVRFVVIGAAPSSAEVARWSRKIREYSTPADSGWDSLPDAERAKHGNVNTWWQRIGKDNRVSSRASFAALKAEVPDYTIAQARDWWGRIGKNKRQRLRAKYTKGYGDDFLGDIAKVATKAADIVSLGPIARQIPIVKDVHGAVQKLQQLPMRGVLEVARGGRLDRVAVNQFKTALGAAKTLAPYVQTVVSFVPGLGTGLAAGLGGALALASGQRIDQAFLSAIRSAVPGGALAQAAFDVTSSIVQGKPIEQIALSAIPIDAGTKATMLRAAQAARALAEGKRVDQVVLDQVMRALPPEAQKAAQIATAVAQAKNLQDAAAKGAKVIAPNQAMQTLTANLPRIAPQMQKWGARAVPALSLVQRANQGDPRAKSFIQNVARARQSAAVHPKVQQLMTMLQEAFAALQQAPVRSAVAGALASTCCDPSASFAEAGAGGRWVAAADGQQVWVPNDPHAPLRAETGGPVFDWLASVVKPHVGYRSDTQAYTMRDAYRSGIDALATR